MKLVGWIDLSLEQTISPVWVKRLGLIYNFVCASESAASLLEGCYFGKKQRFQKGNLIVFIETCFTNGK